MVTVVSKPIRKRRAAFPHPRVSVPGVRVLPANEELRKLLRHPNGTGFRPTGSIEWPDDRFTHRRLRDGDITIEEKSEDAPVRRGRRSEQPSE
jgi:hypothetical protein